MERPEAAVLEDPDPAIGSVTMQDWIVPVAAGVLALVALALAVALLRARSRTDRVLAQAQAETAVLRDQVDDWSVGWRPADRRRREASFVITDLGADDGRGPPGRAPRRRSAPRSSPTWCSARPSSRPRRSPTAYGVRSTPRPATGSGSR